MMLYHFADPNRFADHPVTVNEILVYVALPLKNQLNLDGSDTTNGDPFWDVTKPELRQALIARSDTTQRLADLLRKVHDLLEALDMPGVARNFDPSRAITIKSEVHRRNGASPTEGALTRFLRVESLVINEAVKAGTKIAHFVSQAGSKPTEAVKALAEFGEKITDAFNHQITDISIGGGKLRPLGTMAMIEAARALGVTQPDVQASALLDLIFLKRGTSFNLADFLKGQLPPDDAVALRQRLVNL